MNSLLLRAICLSALLIPAFDGLAADFSPIHGFWSIAKERCKNSDRFWQIRPTGASRIEELCEVVSSSRKGNRFVLKQQCAAEGMEYSRTDTFNLLSSGQLENERMRYKRCPDPYNGGT
jgi:hypothetical protein